MNNPKRCLISTAVGLLTFTGLMYLGTKTVKAQLRKEYLRTRMLKKRIKEIKQTNLLMKLVTHDLTLGKDVSIAFKNATKHINQHTKLGQDVLKAVRINYNPHYIMSLKVKMGLDQLLSHTHDAIFDQYLRTLKHYHKQKKQLDKLQKLSEAYQKFTKKVIHKVTK